MLGFLLCMLLFVYQGIVGNSNDYNYMDDIPNVKSSDGSRLVGARAAKTSKYPFLVGWNQYGVDNSFSCTGSLVTPSFILSAAHCNGMINQHDGVERNREECVNTTNRGEYYTNFALGTMMKIKCKWLESGDLEIRTKPKGKAWIGVDDVKKNTNKNKKHMSKIKRHIRHPQSYRAGGTYGLFGGYDITLLELEKPMVGYQPVCLPGPKFDDIRLHMKDSKLAGYGKYLRSDGQTCETNKFGEMKIHYCDKQFGEGSSACITDESPPISKECKHFFTDPDTPVQVPGEVEEIVIQGQSENGTTYCYPETNPENPEYGWCKTKGNFYDPERTDEEYKGWGFCGKDCFLNTNTMNSGILREKSKVEILPEKLCDDFLARSLEETVEVRPMILCVARQEKWKEAAWQKTGDGYQAMRSGSGVPMRYGSDGYVASVGTCQGDSGGPVFVEEGGRYVVTGIVSGGRGKLGECGGINNPIHYTRVKMFAYWILNNLKMKQRKQVCWDRELQIKMNQSPNFTHPYGEEKFKTSTVTPTNIP